MATLQIGLIQGTPSFATLNRSNVVNPASPGFTLWSSMAPPIPEGLDGSSNCCTFLMPTAPGDPIPISVSGVAAVLPSTETFILQGLWNNTIIFQTPELVSPKTPAFIVPINQLQLVGRPTDFPCRLAGDWTWKIGPPGGPWSQSGVTLLEINYVWAGPPEGPISPPDGTLARPDFEGSYPADLFRLFLPDPTQIPTTGDLTAWYLTRSMLSIWRLGLALDNRTAGTRTVQYESIKGYPAYIDSNLGGVFQLRRFINTMFGTVNCYDLAGITQLAMAIIQNTSAGQQVEVFDSKWIYCDGYGYIPSGPLIGWPQYPNCNSPYFGGSLLPYYADPNDSNRQYFWTHSWIEVTDFSGKRVVLDATHCLETAPNSPESGTNTRANFLNIETDSTGGAFIHTYTYNPESRNEQIGVTNVGQIPAFVVRSHGITAEVDAISPQLINNASFDPATVQSIVKQVVPNAIILNTDTTTGSAGSQILVTMLGAHKEQINVQISNYELFADTVNEYNAAKQTLQKILPPDGFLSTKPLGDDAIRTACSVLFRRNAVIIRVFINPVLESDISQLSVTTLRVSQLLDSHITKNAVRGGLEARPSPILREDPNVSVVKGSRFSLHLDNVVDASDVRIAEVADYKIVLSAGVGDLDGTYSFYATGEGKTLVKLSVAHKEKLTVSAKEVWVTVVADDEAHKE